MELFFKYSPGILPAVSPDISLEVMLRILLEVSMRFYFQEFHRELRLKRMSQIENFFRYFSGNASRSYTGNHRRSAGNFFVDSTQYFCRSSPEILLRVPPGFLRLPPEILLGTPPGNLLLIFQKFPYQFLPILNEVHPKFFFGSFSTSQSSTGNLSVYLN